MYINPIVKSIYDKIFPAEHIDISDLNQQKSSDNDCVRNRMKTINTEGEEKRNNLKNIKHTPENNHLNYTIQSYWEKSRLPSPIDTQNIPAYAGKQRHGKSEKVKQKKKRSTSLAPRVHSERKRRTRSTLKRIEVNRPLKKSESIESLVKTTNYISYTPRNGVKDDPVKDQWAKNGTAQTVYSVSAPGPLKPNPTKYWVKTELQYVIVLPTDNRRRKSSTRPFSAVGTPTGRDSVRKSILHPPPSAEGTPGETRKSKEWEPTALEGKELGPQDKESFSSLTFDESGSDSSISDAKPAPKPKGRFCCWKRQDSG